MLKLNGQDFTTGRATFLDRLPTDAEPTAKIYLKLRPGELEATILAQLDTGSAWSVLAPDIAQAVGLRSETGEPKKLSARGLIFDGHLVRVPVLILADEGDSLEVTATVFISNDWPAGKNFIGYSGLLESIRIALDPQSNDFYFGAAQARDSLMGISETD